MPDIRFDTEKELIAELMQSRAYSEFKHKQLQPKIAREQRAWELLEEHKGHHTRDTLNKIFDTVDLYDNNKRWFGCLLATPNRNLILATEPEIINQWLGDLLFAGAGPL